MQEDKIIEELCQTLVNAISLKIKTHQDNIIKTIDQIFTNNNKKIINSQKQSNNKQINQPVSKPSRGSPINIQELKEPPLVILEKIDNTNNLINFIFQCLSANKSFVLYFLNPMNEEIILQQSQKDQTEIYLLPSILKLLDNVWTGKDKTYNMIEIHEKLKSLMQNDYNSKNPGNIINSIFNQLHKEFNSNKNLVINSNWNSNKEQVLNDYLNNLSNNNSLISNEFFIALLLEKQESDHLFLVDSTNTIDLNVNNIKRSFLSIENDFKELFIDENDEKKYCNNKEKFVGKSIQKLPNQLIININRAGKKKKHLNFRTEIETKKFFNNGEIGQIYQLIANICSKNEGNIFAYIKSFINDKWYLYNDNDVKIVENEDSIIDEDNSILLFYQKK